jgi:hypothetical protein
LNLHTFFNEKTMWGCSTKWKVCKVEGNKLHS